MASLGSSSGLTRPEQKISSERSGLLHKSKSSMRLESKTGHSAEAKLTPFYLRWVFGMTCKIPPVNLIKPDRPLIFYASSHSGVLYDIKTKEMKIMHGHQNRIKSISVDASGRWVATADAGEDNVIIVWDSDSCMPIFTHFNYCEQGGTRAVGLSPDAKYLVAVSREAHQTISLWLWTYGRDDPEDAVSFETTVGKFHRLVFSPDDSHQFAVMSLTHVIFLLWDEDDTHTLKAHMPVLKRQKLIGNFTDITYVNGTHQTACSTVNGYVIIFCDVPYLKAFEPTPVSHEKEIIKLVRLEENSINVIQAVDKFIATGNSLGQIRFYDQQLLLLYWCQNFELDAISDISFNVTPRLCILKEPEDSVPDSGRSRKGKSSTFVEPKARTSEGTSESLTDDRSQEFEEIYRNLLPTDYTIEESPFLTRDFIVCTACGQIGVVDFIKNSCQFILHKSEAIISAIDCHPEEKLLCIGNAAGSIFSYNYRTKDLVTQYNITEAIPKESEEDSELIIDECTTRRSQFRPQQIIEDPDAQRCITYLQYDPSGFTLACGMADGSLWFLHPTLLTPMIKSPFNNLKAPIKKICFSSDTRFMAVIDEEMRVGLYQSDNIANGEWLFVGKRRSHYKPISDILFSEISADPREPPVRLFSLGEDRMLIEYDLFNSVEGELKVLNAERIEQSAVPLCMAWYPKFTDETYLFTANSEFKYKLLDMKTRMCSKTILGPTFGSPVSHIKILPKKDKAKQANMIFVCKKFIGIQMLPADGNPYKSVGITGHHRKVKTLCVSSDQKYVFSLGERDFSLQMWYLNPLAVDVMVRVGGENLNPYYSLIEGGENGWLFREIRDLFCYSQIIHQGENTFVERMCSNKIPLCEIPDLMRAIGFYPSEYEVENMIHEVSHCKMHETGELVNEIEFEDFVRLYINHHPAFGVSAEELKKAIDNFAENVHDDSEINRDTFLSILLENGEAFTPGQAAQYLKILCPVEKWRDEGRLTEETYDDEEDEEEKSGDTEEDFSFLPEEFSYSTFMDDILGITVNPPTEENCQPLSTI